MKEFSFLITGLVLGAFLHRQHRRAADAEAVSRVAQSRPGEGAPGR